MADPRDWRNDHGFDAEHEESTPVALRIEGRIPSYAAGVLYRTGPGKRQLSYPDGKKFTTSHWFDGYTQVHRFELVPDAQGDTISRVMYNSRFSCDALMDSVARTGSMDGVTFAQKRDPCESLFQKVSSFFVSLGAVYLQHRMPKAEERNVGVTVSYDMPGLHYSAEKNRHTLHNKTDASLYQELDPQTLEPVGIVFQTSLHPKLTGQLSASHAKSCPLTGDVFNYNLELGLHPRYRIFRVCTATNTTEILATIEGAGVCAAYVHSLFLTENYVVLCVWGSYFQLGGARILWERNMLDAMVEWDPEAKNHWYVVSRHGDGLVASYTGDPFFAFHTVNAWEDDDGGIMCDLVTYENTDVLKRFYYDNLMSTGSGAHLYSGDKGASSRPRLERWRLPDIMSIKSTAVPKAATKIWRADPTGSIELPAINPSRLCCPSRYIYGFTDYGLSTLADGIAKYDTTTHEVLRWSEAGHTPGEPVFIQNPDGEAEDDGILLSVVLSAEGNSYLLVLDARDMTVVGKAWCKRPVGLGFHGVHVSALEGSHRPVDI